MGQARKQEGGEEKNEIRLRFILYMCWVRRSFVRPVAIEKKGVVGSVSIDLAFVSPSPSPPVFCALTDWLLSP